MRCSRQAAASLTNSLNTTVKYGEQELVALLQQRNEGSFAYLYDNYAGALLGVINAVLPEPETARDVLQDVFINIWRRIDSYDASKGRLFTWMMNVARNAAIDKLRSKGYQNTNKNRPIPEGDNSLSLADAPHMEDVGLRAQLRKLKEEHRILIDLSYYRGYTHEEIAKMLDIPLGTVKTRIRTALTQLRTMIS